MASVDQQAYLERLLRQERELQFKSFDSAAALAMGLQLVEAASAVGQSVLVDIRMGDLQLFQHAMSGTSLDNADWIRRKINVVRRFGHSSLYIACLYRARGTSFQNTYLDPCDFAACGGGFPLSVRGVGMVGTIAVSGLPHEEDHEAIVAALGVLIPERPHDA